MATILPGRGELSSKEDNMNEEGDGELAVASSLKRKISVVEVRAAFSCVRVPKIMDSMTIACEKLKIK